MINKNIQKLSQIISYHRFDAEFYQKENIIDFSKGEWKPIKNFLDVCQYGISQAMDENPIGYPIFRMDDIRNSFLIDENVKYLELSDAEFVQYKLHNNDILFNRVNSEEFVGRTGIFKLDGDYIFASYLIRLRVKTDSDILPDYLNIFLNSKFGKKQIHRYMRRAVNQANVNAQELKNFLIPIIPIKIQEKIKQLSDDSWKQRLLTASLYEQAQEKFFKKLSFDSLNLSEKTSFTKTLSQTFVHHRMDSEFYEPKYDELENHLITKLNAKPISHLSFIDVTTGQYTDEYTEQSAGKPFIRGTNLEYGTVEMDDLFFIPYEKQIESKKAKEGDVVVTRVGTIGLTARIPKECNGCTISDNLIRLRFSEKKLNSYFLGLFLDTKIGKSLLIRNSRGSVQQRLNQETLKDVVIPIPSDKIQTDIADLIIKSQYARILSKKLMKQAIFIVEETIEKL